MASLQQSNRLSETHHIDKWARCLPPSPPAEKTTASKDQAGKSSTYDGAGDSTGDRRIVVSFKAAVPVARGAYQLFGESFHSPFAMERLKRDRKDMPSSPSTPRPSERS